jgi:hypothetical protein
MMQIRMKHSASIALVIGLAVGLSGCVGTLKIMASGFQPIHPVITYRDRFPAVESLSPTLKWEPFPGEDYNVPIAPIPVVPRPTPFVNVVGVVSNIRYDLIIWKAVNPKYDDFSEDLSTYPFPGLVWSSVDSLSVVYERDGLADTSHTVDTLLEPNIAYAWSVRARFDQNGETRISEWSLVAIPDPLAYRATEEHNRCTTVIGIFNSGCRNPATPPDLQTSREQARATGKLPSYALYYFTTPSR